jgi:hypothetical protein
MSSSFPKRACAALPAGVNVFLWLLLVDKAYPLAVVCGFGFVIDNHSIMGLCSSK